TAVVVKLIRVMMLAPFILALSAGLTHIKHCTNGKQKDKCHKATIVMPWFVLAFMATAIINSMLTLPEIVKSSLALASQFSLALAMAALGAHTRWATIKVAGIKPLMLALILFIMLIFGGYFLTSWLC
ncbi:MAG: putative sulfate exporter family transporter, partial [Alteromonadales bacterium]|nr:putative sulfate exporter family transporter [Alteromonadales bacterium]